MSRSTGAGRLRLAITTTSARAALLAGLGLVAAGLLAAGCGGTKGSNVPVTEVTARPNAAGVQEVHVEVHSFYYKPNRIVVTAGQPVDLVLHFKSLFVPHNLTCEHPDGGIQIDRSAGFMSFRRTKHVRFTPQTPGEYGFFCGVGSHMRKGMTGTLVVK